MEEGSGITKDIQTDNWSQLTPIQPQCAGRHHFQWGVASVTHGASREKFLRFGFPELAVVARGVVNDPETVDFGISRTT